MDVLVASDCVEARNRWRKAVRALGRGEHDACVEGKGDWERVDTILIERGFLVKLFVLGRISAE